jgi:D-3-phosphoglycerate dehydrogenase
MKILLTHTPRAREQYYGPEALAALAAAAETRLHEGEAPLGPDALVAAAADVDLIVADRATAVPAAVFGRLPALRAVLRVAVDISTIDVAAASAAGVLVTRARPGFVAAVSELALGMMIDLSRGISRSVLAYRAGDAPEIRMGRQLAGSTAGIIGYGVIGRRLAAILAGLGMEVLVSDPHAAVTEAGLVQVGLPELLARADYVVCLAVASPETRDLIDAAALARSSSTCPAAASSTRTRWRRPCGRGASPAPPSMSAGRPTRCRARASPPCRRWWRRRMSAASPRRPSPPRPSRPSPRFGPSSPAGCRRGR